MHAAVKLLTFSGTLAGDLMKQLSFLVMPISADVSSEDKPSLSRGIARRSRARMSMKEFRKAIALGRFAHLKDNQFHLDAAPEGPPSSVNPPSEGVPHVPPLIPSSLPAQLSWPF